ncbi:MAG: hypothetical protein AVDCRST_MAG89-1850 [uncultured Gemmatimonadetes bacterium]|uniref:Uncharacterized protein n=1 Tax=uncultured Gemmatimonadota bacterium TaxID=203437 RepID=A0A6J4L9V3_9BACT|nr:MAG: hypothetical protein AVDCRST_MAG89-1850 [uncultured Gemmatimonadota bacterium]
MKFLCVSVSLCETAVSAESACAPRSRNPHCERAQGRSG